jgi:hypothetical protein
MPDITENEKAVAAALDVSVDNEVTPLQDMLAFLGTKENQRYDAIFAGVLNLYINSSRIIRGNTLMGPNDAHALISIMGWIRMMKPVNSDLAAYAGTQYAQRGAPERRQ